MLADYDAVILSGNCLDVLARIETLDKKPKIFYYCHTPPRFLFDFRELYLSKIPKFLHKMANIFLDKQAQKYTDFLEKVDMIFTNSQNVHDRLEYFCGKESTIVYPPTDTDFFVPSGDDTHFQKILGKKVPFGYKNYFFSWARLSPPKRVNKIIDAFLVQKDKNLILTYGKNDPMKDEILTKIQGAENIFALCSPLDDELLALIQ